MNVLVVEPGYLPYEKEINGLKEMQETVGGPIQAIYPFEDQVAVVCDEEGLLHNAPFNRSMDGGYGGVFGTFFVCGLGEEDFISLTPEQVKTYRQRFQKAEMLLSMKDSYTPITAKFDASPKRSLPKDKTPPKKPAR